MSKGMSRLLPVALLALGFIGCAQEAPVSPSAPAVNTAPSIDVSQFTVADEPAGAEGVAAVHEHSHDDDEVTVVGRIGGPDPWVEGRVAFSIVDPSLKACSDIPGDKCPTPWDYCCDNDALSKSSALVKLVDEDGTLLKGDPRQLFGVKELQTVVVHGKAKRDDAGNLTILASGIHVKE